MAEENNRTMKTKRQVIIRLAQKMREAPWALADWTLTNIICQMRKALDSRPDFTITERHEIISKTLGKHIDYLIDLQEGTLE